MNNSDKIDKVNTEHQHYNQVITGELWSVVSHWDYPQEEMVAYRSARVHVLYKRFRMKRLSQSYNPQVVQAILPAAGAQAGGGRAAVGGLGHPPRVYQEPGKVVIIISSALSSLSSVLLSVSLPLS